MLGRLKDGCGGGDDDDSNIDKNMNTSKNCDDNGDNNNNNSSNNNHLYTRPTFLKQVVQMSNTHTHTHTYNGTPNIVMSRHAHMTVCLWTSTLTHRRRNDLIRHRHTY